MSAHVGFMIDRLTAVMMVVVTFVSLLVHLYTIGYMEEDPGVSAAFLVTSVYSPSRCSLLVIEQQLFTVVFGLGGSGTGVLPLDRFLVQAAECDICQHEGVFGESRWRLRFLAWH